MVTEGCRYLRCASEAAHCLGTNSVRVTVVRIRSGNGIGARSEPSGSAERTIVIDAIGTESDQRNSNSNKSEANTSDNKIWSSATKTTAMKATTEKATTSAGPGRSEIQIGAEPPTSPGTDPGADDETPRVEESREWRRKEKKRIKKELLSSSDTLVVTTTCFASLDDASNAGADAHESSAVAVAADTGAKMSAEKYSDDRPNRWLANRPPPFAEGPISSAPCGESAPSMSQPSSPMTSRSVVHVKPLVILDLNGILCRRVRRDPFAAEPAPPGGDPLRTVARHRYRPAIGTVALTDVVPRSDLSDFLTLLSRRFALAVWTSATRRTASALVKMLFPPEVGSRLLFVWNRSRCDLVDTDAKEDKEQTNQDASEINIESISGYEERAEAGDGDRKLAKTYLDNSHSCGRAGVDIENMRQPASVPRVRKRKRLRSDAPENNSHRNVIALKALSKVWAQFPLWDASNTILLDDSSDKCPDNYRANALHPPPILGTVTEYSVENPGREQKMEGGGSGGENVGEVDSGASHMHNRTAEYVVVDNDEANQKIQREFFNTLAEFWSRSSVEARKGEERIVGKVGTELASFLEKNASRHMGWHGNTGADT